MGTNSNPGGEGVNSVTPLGSAQKSSNASLGIDGRVASGTTGSRPDMGADKYGGDKSGGTLFKGPSVAKDNREMNSGGNEKKATNADQLGNEKYVKGGVGSRENMPKYGGEENKGSLVGLGAGSTKDISATDQLQRDLPAYPGLGIVKGTADGQENLARAKKGIGKPGSGGQRM